MTSWWNVLRQLTVITLCASLVDLMIPSGSMRRYARLVSGLILMYMLLRPISALFTGLPAADILDTLISQTGGAG